MTLHKYANKNQFFFFRFEKRWKFVQTITNRTPLLEKAFHRPTTSHAPNHQPFIPQKKIEVKWKTIASGISQPTRHSKHVISQPTGIQQRKNQCCSDAYHSEMRNSDTKSGVRSQPDMQWTSRPPCALKRNKICRYCWERHVKCFSTLAGLFTSCVILTMDQLR